MLTGGLRFRQRIALLVSLAAVALVVVTLVTLVFGRRNAEQLSGIEDRYVPLIELDRDLKATFAQLPHALEEAASAADETRLREADAMEAEFLRRLDAGAALIVGNGQDPAALATELRAYYAKARAVSAAIASGTPVAELEADIAAMRAAQLAVTARLDAATTPDERRLAAAFATARASVRASLWIDIAVALLALAVMALWSWLLIRRAVTALHAVSAGVERLARGEFEREIVVASSDEFGDVAREANRTAARLRDAQQREHELLAEARRHTAATEAANKELEAFSYSVSHDLRAPLRAIDGFSQALLEDCAAQLPEQGRQYLDRVRAAAQRMAELIDDLLELSRVSRAEVRRDRVELSEMFEAIVAQLRERDPERSVDVRVQREVIARVDRRLFRIVLENLVGNAWKFTAKTAAAEIEFGARAEHDGGGPVYFVRDNGAGFDMAYANRLFGAFQRLHSDKEFAGTGIGLATVQRIIVRHGGTIWVDAAVDRGATFQFTVPDERKD